MHLRGQFGRAAPPAAAKQGAGDRPRGGKRVKR